MKFKINDYVEYIDSNNSIQKGKIIKTIGLFKNKYMIRTEFIIKDEISIIDKKNIIGRVEENAKGDM